MAKKNHQTLKNIGLRSSVCALASCLVLSGIPLAVQAAGLGKIVVFSALGQPLRAEIEVSATREELLDMKAQLASQEAFKQAGLDYATTLLGFRFSLDKRSNGQSVIKLSSDRPINDPFVDMLLELNWPAGRLVREYTFLLDPPEITAKGSAPVASATTSPVVAASKPAASARAAMLINDELRSKAAAKVRTQDSDKKTAEQSAEGGDVREVKRGDTLHKIASETKPEGVSLEQMLVGLLRANQEAFDGGNMNRLKAGKILSVPEKSVVETVSAVEARKIVVAQSSDWNAYRSKLAGVAARAPVKEDAAKQEAAGKITAKVEDKATAAAEPKDQLRVSRTDATGGKAGVAASKRSEEDSIAKEKALKEANERLSSLEKNVSDLQKLIELKNQNLAELQKQASAKTVPVEAKKPQEEAKPQVQAPVSPVTPAPVSVSPAVKVEPAVTAVEKTVEPKAVEPVATAKPADVVPEPKPEVKPESVEAPKQKPKPVVPPPPPPEEPGFFENLLDNPLLLAGGGGILALIAGFLVARRRRLGKEEAPLEVSSTLSSPTSGLSANSVFRSTGGQSVDTSSHTPAQTDFSQAGPGSIDTDEVDPVAEADVYMAYGRDAQAEEILLEAKQKDPKRYAIYLKLLEIYSNRKDIKQFETLATDLYSETGGVGADWEKAAAMGLRLDPVNPLFGASPRAPATFDADATVIVSSQAMKDTVTLPGELSQLAEDASADELPIAPVVMDEPVEASSVEAADLTSLDFDLGFADEKSSVVADTAITAMDETQKFPEPVIETNALDFDLGTTNQSASAFAGSSIDALDKKVGDLDFSLPDISLDQTSSTAGVKKEGADLDFDLGIGSIESSTLAESEVLPEIPVALAEETPVELSAGDNEGVEFDVDLTESPFLGRSLPETPSFDMSSIDLDLKEQELSTPAEPTLALGAESASDEMPGLSFDSAQMSTAVNPAFATEQVETIVNPQFGIEPDLMPEQDFLVSQNETLLSPPIGAAQELAPDFEITANEEVATKLDLAKAYEEMGDLEGARELLQEVLKEGNADQKEKAQAILSKIGG